jgi:hypothetical protein
MRRNLQSRDYIMMLSVLATIDIAEEPQALDLLICDIVELRSGRAPEHELQAWAARARDYLRRLIGDAPAESAPLAN